MNKQVVDPSEEVHGLRQVSEGLGKWNNDKDKGNKVWRSYKRPPAGMAQSSQQLSIANVIPHILF